MNVYIPQKFNFIETNFDNVIFKYPNDWQVYKNENEGICEVYYFDQNNNYISFMIYFSYDELMNSQQINANLQAQSVRNLSFTQILTKETLLQNQEKTIWYKYSISKMELYYNTKGQNIYLISYTPKDIYENYRNIFDQILDSIGIILY